MSCINENSAKYIVGFVLSKFLTVEPMAIKKSFLFVGELRKEKKLND